MKALASFGGLEGLLKDMKKCADAAGDGSTTKRQYHELVVKLLTHNALAGGAENPSSMPEEELEEQLDIELADYEKRRREKENELDEGEELGTPSDE